MTSRKSDRQFHDRSRILTGKRSLGQNFLVDEAVVDRIVDAFDPKPDDVVLEIGPGHGALTIRLVDRVKSLIALEFDRDLAGRLRERFTDRSNFVLIEDDALAVDFRVLVPNDEPGRLIANLPYNIATVILQRLFEFPGIFSGCVLMFQREVVERMTALPATKERGYLTVMTEGYFDVEHLFDVPPSAFQPAPKIWSAVVRLTPKPETPGDPDAFRHIVGVSFAQKRKTIYNNLRNALPNADKLLAATAIDPVRRAETLTGEEWRRLVESFVAHNPDQA